MVSQNFSRNLTCFPFALGRVAGFFTCSNDSIRKLGRLSCKVLRYLNAGSQCNRQSLGFRASLARVSSWSVTVAMRWQMLCTCSLLAACTVTTLLTCVQTSGQLDPCLGPPRRQICRSSSPQLRQKTCINHVSSWPPRSINHTIRC